MVTQGEDIPCTFVQTFGRWRVLIGRRMFMTPREFISGKTLLPRLEEANELYTDDNCGSDYDSCHDVKVGCASEGS